MPTKAEVLKEIEDSSIRSYTPELVKSLVNKVRQEREKTFETKSRRCFCLPAQR